MCSWWLGYLTSSIWWGFSQMQKQLRRFASNTVVWVLQMGATAEDMGEGPVSGRLPRVLLGYNVRNCTFVLYLAVRRVRQMV